MEEALLLRLTVIMDGLGLACPLDARKTLPVNPNGIKFRLRDVNALKGLAAHQELGWGSVRGVSAYHISHANHAAKGQGTESIMYTGAIDEEGRFYLCNNMNKSTWSQGDASRSGDENKEFLSIMFVGNFHGEGHRGSRWGEPNHRQMLCFMALWQVCKDLWGWNDDDLYGHYHFGKSACPGNTLKAVINAIRSNAFPNLQEVKGRQEALKSLGYYRGAIDGMWGAVSKAALILFQGENGVSPDGRWGATTENVIRKRLQAGCT